MSYKILKNIKNFFKNCKRKQTLQKSKIKPKLRILTEIYEFETEEDFKNHHKEVMKDDRWHFVGRSLCNKNGKDGIQAEYERDIKDNELKVIN